MAKYKDPNTGQIIEVGNPELNPNLIAGKTLVPDTTNISSAILQPSTDTNYQSPVEIPPSSPANVDSSIPEPIIPTPLTPAEKAVQDQIKGIQAGNTELTGQTAFIGEQEKAVGFQGLLDTQKSISKRILALQADDKNLESKMQLGAEGRGITAAGLAPHTMAERRRISIDANILGAQLSASQLDVASAQDQINKAVRDKFGPLEEAQKTRIANLDLLLKDPQLTADERKRGEEQKKKEQDRADQIAKDKQSQADIWKISTDASANSKNFTPTPQYPDLSLTLKAISEAKTKEEALQIATITGLTKQTNLPASAQEYEYAKSQGYKGTYIQYQNEDANRKAIIARGGVGTFIPLTTTDRQNLLGVGLSQPDITNIEKDINEYGLEAVLAGVSDSKQKSAIKKAYSGQGIETQFITKEFLTTQFAGSSIDSMLKTLGKKRDDYAKFWSSSATEEQNIRNDFNKYIETLMPIVEQYRAAGYTDKEILALMK